MNKKLKKFLHLGLFVGTLLMSSIIDPFASPTFGQEVVGSPTYVVERVNNFQIIFRQLGNLENSQYATPLNQDLVNYLNRIGRRFSNGSIVVSGSFNEILNLWTISNRNAGAARVVGPGSIAAPEEHIPWQVALIDKKNFRSNLDSQRCGGSILAPTWVVTAAHCFNGIRRADFEESTFVGYGTADLEKGNVQKVEIEKVFLSERFEHAPPGATGSSQSYRNDIALLKLKKPIMLNQTAKPIRYLPASEAVRLVRDGMQLQVSGWGHVVPAKPGQEPRIRAQIVRSPNLLFTSVDAITTERCRSMPFVGAHASDHFVCALGSDGGDACTNDSGGPLVSFQHPSREPALVGIVSFGFGCGQRGIPGMYTNVALHFDWISRIISQAGQ
ncbi:MAG: serine protease [Magnetospirillum sp.]|jgi:secreted trypsin-like serine protease|nr:serine protease [Magnetospirillum sp.]